MEPKCDKVTCPDCGKKTAEISVTQSIFPVEFPGDYISIHCDNCGYYQYRFQPADPQS